MAIVLEPGTIVADRYRLDRILGQGGMGVVWAATHAITRRGVAMKFVRNTLQTKTELRRRLLREAHAAAAVQHPNVVEILDVFELDAETPVIVMTLLHGETLAQRLAREPPLSLAEAAGYLLPAISAIGTAHARGVVHRDLKPDNIYLSEGPDGSSVKVLDFGIAKLVDRDYAASDSVSTQTGSTLGTPSYMAPEQAAGEKDLDHRADVWALGVIAYECLSGVRPIEGENAAQVIMRLMTTGITPLSRVTRGLPEEVTALVDRMLARERARRCPDLREAQRTFARYTDVTAQEFGAPGSALSTTFERDSRRSSAPVVLSRIPPPENHSLTLHNDAPDLREPAPIQRKRSARVLALIASATSLVGFLGWRFGGGSARPSRVLATTTSAVLLSSTRSAATTGSGSSRPSAMPNPAEVPNTAFESTDAPVPTGPPASLKFASSVSTRKLRIPSASSASPELPESAGQPQPPPATAASTSAAPPSSDTPNTGAAPARRPGLVVKVPF